MFEQKPPKLACIPSHPSIHSAFQLRGAKFSRFLSAPKRKKVEQNCGQGNKQAKAQAANTALTWPARP